MDNNAKNQFNTPVNTFIQPFAVLYNHSTFHVILYFEGHKEYEAVEAMIREKKSGDAFIRIIVTRHDQTQTDYINDRETVENIINSGSKRETYYKPIKYSHNVKSRKPHVFLKFTTQKDEEVEFDFYCAKAPSPKYSGLIDPENHSEKTSLPIMYRQASTLAHPKSKISFNGISYMIPVKIRIPVLFTGMKGFYSENFSMAVFRTLTENLKITGEPGSPATGQKWEYSTPTGKRTYEIMECANDKMTVSSHTERVHLQLVDSELFITGIELVPETLDKNILTIEFIPGMPLNPKYGIPLKPSDFKVLIGDSTTLLTGKAIAASENGSIKYQLLPESPAWASKRPVLSIVEKTATGYTLSTRIGRGTFD